MAFDAQTFDLNEMADQQTSDEMVKEANAFKTVPAGKYRLTTEKAEGRISGEKAPWGQGVKMLHLQVEAKSETRKTKLFLDVTPIELRRENGKLFGPSKLWGNYVKALDCQGQPFHVVLDAIQKYPVDAFVTESFKMPDGTYSYPRNDEERALAVKGGGEPQNFIQSVTKAA